MKKTNWVPTVTTSRTSIPDDEGVVVSKNNNGVYMVRIRGVQEPIEVFINFTVSNQPIISNKVWSSNGHVYIFTELATYIQIYNLTGSLVNTTSLNAGETHSLPLPTGIYVVKTNTKTYKVSVN